MSIEHFKAELTQNIDLMRDYLDDHGNKTDFKASSRVARLTGRLDLLQKAVNALEEGDLQPIPKPLKKP